MPYYTGPVVYRTIEQVVADRDLALIRLATYVEAELRMLSPTGVEEYQIGSHRLRHYTLDLTSVRKAIVDMKQQVDMYEAELLGASQRRSYSMVRMDY